MDTIRTFIAVPIDPEPVKAIDRLVRPWRARSSGIRWVDSANFHITLAFLGEVAVERLTELFAATQEVCAVHEPFDISLEGFGAFPSERRPRVIKIGVGAGALSLGQLASDLADELELLGYRREQRSFSPHLTIGRVKGPIRFPQEKAKVFADYADWVAGVSHVHAIEVMGSHREASGPRYSVLARVPL